MSLSYDSHCTFEFCIMMSRQIEIVSASLLVTPSHSSRPDSNFCLELLDWCLCCIRKSKMCSKSLKLKRPRVSQNVEISTEKAEESLLQRATS